MKVHRLTGTKAEFSFELFRKHVATEKTLSELNPNYNSAKQTTLTNRAHLSVMSVLKNATFCNMCEFSKFFKKQ